MYWFNYKTNEYENREAPQTDDEALELIPQHPPAQGLYRCHRALGLGILESLKEVLMECVGANSAKARSQQ